MNNRKKSIFNQFLEYNFPINDVFLQNNEDYHKRTKQRLMSFSGFSNYLNNYIFDKIPKFVLDNAKEFGSQVMSTMGLLLANKENVKLLDDVNAYALSSDVADCCKEILHTLKTRKLHLRAVDKWVTNGYWKGIIDFIVKTSVLTKRTDGIPILIEFKTRNSDEVKWTDYLQLSIYKTIVEPFKITSREDISTPAEIWVYNKKTKRVTTYKMDYNTYRDCLKILNQLLDLYGLDKYKLSLKRQYYTDEELETFYGIKKYNRTFYTRKHKKE